MNLENFLDKYERIAKHIVIINLIIEIVLFMVFCVIYILIGLIFF